MMGLRSAHTKLHSVRDRPRTAERCSWWPIGRRWRTLGLHWARHDWPRPNRGLGGRHVPRPSRRTWGRRMKPSGTGSYSWIKTLSLVFFLTTSPTFPCPLPHRRLSLPRTQMTSAKPPSPRCNRLSCYSSKIMTVRFSDWICRYQSSIISCPRSAYPRLLHLTRHSKMVGHTERTKMFAPLRQMY